MTRKRGGEAGFTLVELLTVLAIVVILAAILTPVFARVREKGRQAACLTNLKELGIATLGYLQDFDENMLCYVNQTTKDASGNGTYYWTNALDPYVKLRQLWYCPSYPQESGPPTANSSTYGVNLDHVVSSINGASTPLAMSQFTRPASILFATDTQDSATVRLTDPACSRFAAGFLRTYCPQTSKQTDMPHGLAGCVTVRNTAGIDIRHMQGANVVFLDGHTRWTNGLTLLKSESDMDHDADIFGHWSR